MLPRVRVITVLLSVGLGIVPQFSLAQTQGTWKELKSIFLSGQSPAVSNGMSADGVTAGSSYCMAQKYAEQNDIVNAHKYYSLALKNALTRQVPSIASGYAVFLLNNGDLHKAELILRQAVAQAPNDAELTTMLARCLVRQDKMMEGLRYFRSVYSETEAREEIAAIYREQGNADMLAAVEQKWGHSETTPVRTVPIRSEPVMTVSTPRPAVFPAAKYAQILVPPSPAVIPGTERNTPPVPVAIARQEITPEEVLETKKKPETKPEVAQDLPTKIVIQPSIPKSGFFDTKVPIPVPNTLPQPMAALVSLPNRTSASAAPVSLLSAPVPMTTRTTTDNLIVTDKPITIDQTVVTERAELNNPVRLAMIPKPKPTLTALDVPPKPATGVQPRRRYIVNADSSSDLDILFPVKPAG